MQQRLLLLIHTVTNNTVSNTVKSSEIHSMPPEIKTQETSADVRTVNQKKRAAASTHTALSLQTIYLIIGCKWMKVCHIPIFQLDREAVLLQLIKTAVAFDS